MVGKGKEAPAKHAKRRERKKAKKKSLGFHLPFFRVFSRVSRALPPAPLPFAVKLRPMKIFALASALLFLPVSATLAAPAATGGGGSSSVPRLASEFVWRGAGNVGYPLKKLRGQPVVILVAPTADSRDFRQQAGRIEKIYLDMAARKVVFIAALTQTGDRILRPQSSVPFVLAADGAAVASAYGFGGGKFGLVVVGPDGNVDSTGARVIGARQILDVVNNSFQPQNAGRKGPLGGG